MDIATLRSLPASEQAAILSRLPLDKQQAFAKALKTLLAWERTNKFHMMFPDAGPLRRELYRHHQQFFADGKWAQYRAFIGGNGTGKTEGGGYEATCHGTGDHPEWWPGWIPGRPVNMWVAGDTTKTCRDIIQYKLFGTRDFRDGDFGTGIIPASALGKPRPSNQLAGLIDWVPIKHKSGKWSRLDIKSYEQGRTAFQGSEIDFIWLDEQCPTDIYEECLHRFRGKSADGRLIMTFTGLQGATDVALMFLPELSDPAKGLTLDKMKSLSRSRVVCAMEDVPHLTAQEIAQKLGNTTGSARETRRTGIPYTGSGRIYRVEESVFVVEPFFVPRYWPRVWSADFGFGSKDNGSGTACVWGAWDRENDVVYIYAEYFQAEMPRAVHAAAIQNRGKWIPGVGDYAGKADDGKTTLQAYSALGLDIAPANKAVMAGIDSVTERLSQGRLKVFATCQRWVSEYRLYQYAPNGTIKKERDHLMDCTRYLVMSGLERARTQAIERPQHIPSDDFGL